MQEEIGSKYGKTLCYIAAPYSSNPLQNTKEALAVAEWMYDLGIYPVVPHLTYLWAQHYEHTYEEWMDLDEGLLDRCDCVYRMPGVSPGADREVDRAIKLLQIPVFYDPIAFQHFAKTRVQHA